MRALDFDLSGIEDVALLTALDELARKKWHLNALRAQVEQEQLARECREAKSVDGMGQLTRRIHSFAYHDWGLKLGSFDCWQDKGFNKYIDRIAPETKVKCTGTKLQVGYSAPSGWFVPLAERAEPRFTKRYDSGEAEKTVSESVSECVSESHSGHAPPKVNSHSPTHPLTHSPPPPASPTEDNT